MYIYLINEKTIKITDIKKVEVCYNDKVLTLTDILFVLKLNRNLLSIKAASKNSITVKFKFINIVFSIKKLL